MTQPYIPKLVIMAKRPAAGRVKTRLGRGIGPARAAYFYNHLLKATMQRLAGDPRWQTWLAIAPDVAVTDAYWPQQCQITAQGPGNLGQRLSRLMNGLPPGPVVIIGSDIPGITVSDIAKAFKALGSADVVFGPAHDGGYWLVGQKRLPQVYELFDEVRWSTKHTLKDSLINALGLKVAMLSERVDIDEHQDFAKAGNAGRLIVSAV